MMGPVKKDFFESLSHSAGYSVVAAGGVLHVGEGGGIAVGIPIEIFNYPVVYEDPEFQSLCHSICGAAGELYTMSIDPKEDLSFLDQGPGSATTKKTLVFGDPHTQQLENIPQALALESDQVPVSLGSADMFGQKVTGSNQIYTYIAADHDCLLRAAYAYNDGTLSVRLAIKGDTGFTVATRKHLKAVGFSVYDDYASIHMTVGDDLILARKALGSALFAAHAWGEVAFDFLPAIPVTNTPDISNTPKAQDFVDDVEDF